jgi:hypothetical protein
MYPSVLEIKDTTFTSSYFDISLKIDADGKLTIQLFNKHDYFNFAIVNFPYILAHVIVCSNILVYMYHLHIAYILQMEYLSTDSICKGLLCIRPVYTTDR